MKAMVLAAGYGTRFRPVTETLPKPLVPVCNRPLIGWIVDTLVAAGVTEVVVNLHHLPDMLRAWLDREFAGRCAIAYSHEPEILGTGGGLRKVRGHFEGEQEFVVVNGDTIQWPPYAALCDALRTTGAIATMLLKHPPEGDRFTRVWFDGRQVTAIGDRGQGEPLMFSGVHALTPRVFGLLPDRAFSAMTEDFYIPVLDMGADAIAGAVHDGLWFDVGSPARYLAASRALTVALVGGGTETPPGSHAMPETESIAADDSEVWGQVSKTVVGTRSVIESDAEVSDSAVWDGVRIHSGSRVASSVVASGVTLPPGSIVANALVCLDRGRVVAVPVDPALQTIARI